jgi:hypothetical protein
MIRIGIGAAADIESGDQVEDSAPVKVGGIVRVGGRS